MRAKTVNKNKIFLFLFVCLFLDAYKFFSIGNRDFTIWYIGAACLIFIAVLRPRIIIKGLRINPYAGIMVVYMVINYFIFGRQEATSLLIGLLCWIFYICSYRRCTVSYFMKTVRFFQIGMNIFAVYGIYQVFASRIGLPFSNLWIEGFMVDGYNWSNNIKIGSLVLRRANAIFREPSFFSQFLAMNMLIYFTNIIGNVLNKRKTERKYFAWLIINGIAIILSFSGTGLIILGAGAVILLYINNPKETRRFLRKHAILTAIVIVGLIVVIVIPNPLTKYLLSRMTEFDYTNIYSISGYLRLILPYQAALEVITMVNPFFGLGIGNARFYRLEKTGRMVGNSIQPIIARTLVEEGLIGGFLLFGFIKRTWRRKNIDILPVYAAITIGTYIMSFMHGTWSSEVFWLFLGFLNLDFVTTSKDSGKARV